MTREELLEEIDRERKWLDEAGYTTYNIDIVFSYLRERLKALEQEPVLEKIIAEIDEKISHYEHFSSSYTANGLTMAREIVEKYRGEK